jgi:hypothetical protein
VTGLGALITANARQWAVARVLTAKGAAFHACLGYQYDHSIRGKCGRRHAYFQWNGIQFASHRNMARLGFSKQPPRLIVDSGQRSPRETTIDNFKVSKVLQVKGTKVALEQ